MKNESTIPPIPESNPNSQSNLSPQNTQNISSNPSLPNFQSSPNSQPPHTFLPQHGHYRNLRVYQVTEIIYDITYYFTHQYLSKGDRTIDQMVQAARSGKQNIAEGNQAQPHPAKQKSNSPMWLKQALKNCLTITKTICVCETLSNGAPYTHATKK